MRVLPSLPAAGLPIVSPRPSLLLGPALPRRRSLLLPSTGERGRGRVPAARDAAIRGFLSRLPEGAAITLREVLAAAGLRSAPGHLRAAREVLAAAGWRSPGPGRRAWTREPAP